VFFALTAETWEVVIETETPQFLALVGLLAALTLGVLFLMANDQLRQAQQQLTGEEPLDDRDQPEKSAEPWERLSKQAMRKGPSKDEQTTATVKELLATVPDPPGDGRKLVAELGWRMRVNALLVVAVYQALVLVPVGLSALLLFWGVGQLAVSKDMAAEWAFGDSAGTDKMDQIDAMSFVREPWTRVPVVLAAFAVLYLSVSLLTNKEHRTYFFSAASAALRQRLAVRVAYRLCFGDGTAVADTREGEEAAARAGAQGEATVAGAGAQPTTRPAPARRQARTRRHGLPLPIARSSDSTGDR
jgi:hypothetical protein